MADGFKPNIYPVLYWALAYGVAAGLLLLLISLLSRYITIVWFPVFLAGLAWGGYRNYRKQKLAWEQATGTTAVPQSPMHEFRAAVSDIATASQDLFNQDAEQQEVPLAPESDTYPPESPEGQNPPSPPLQ